MSVPDLPARLAILAETVGLTLEERDVAEIGAALDGFLQQGERIIRILPELSERDDSIIPASVYDADA